VEALGAFELNLVRGIRCARIVLPMPPLTGGREFGADREPRSMSGASVIRSRDSARRVRCAGIVVLPMRR
jgi:hypothetical protein